MNPEDINLNLDDLREDVKEYKDILEQIQRLETKKDIIRSNIMNALTITRSDELNYDGYGKFSIGKRREWTYPKEILIKEKELEQIKKDAQLKGEANCIEKEFLVFKSK